MLKILQKYKYILSNAIYLHQVETIFLNDNCIVQKMWRCLQMWLKGIPIGYFLFSF